MIRPIDGHPNYFVTDSGEVLSNLTKDKILRVLRPDISTGHPRVTVDGEKFYVSSLVMEAFDPKHDDNQKIFHVDGDNTNNEVDNLQWLTDSQIQRYSNYTKEYRQSDAFRRELLAEI